MGPRRKDAIASIFGVPNAATSLLDLSEPCRRELSGDVPITRPPKGLASLPIVSK